MALGMILGLACCMACWNHNVHDLGGTFGMCLGITFGIACGRTSRMLVGISLEWRWT